MTKNKKLINNIDLFFSEVVEDYKEVTLDIRRDSTPMAIFRKKNYRSHIDRLKECKKEALKLNPKDIPMDPGDKEGIELKAAFEHALVMFTGLCDCQIQVQTAFQETANKKGTKFSDCKDATNKFNAHNKESQAAFHKLDVLYADYTE